MNKTLNKNAVLMAATNLFLAQGTATTLEVKEELRKAGYKAYQVEVSAYVSQLAIEEDWKHTDNGVFRTYTAQQIPAVLANPTNTLPPASNAKVSNFTAKNPKQQFIADARLAANATNPGDWEVNSVDGVTKTVMYFKNTVTRDEVRRYFATETNSRHVDSRSRKLK